MKQSSILMLMALLLSSCYKNKMDDPMVVDITAINPITQEPFKGVKFYITEVKDKFSVGLNSNQKRTQIYSGETDASGKAHYEFEVPKKYKWTYEINFDFTQMDVPTGDYYINKGGSFDYLQRNYDNVFEFELMPKINFVKNIKNTNCYDENDMMRFRIKYLHSGSGNWSSWGITYYDYFHGCINETSILYKPQDIYIYIYEVESTKNNIITSYIDTFKVTAVDTFKIYY